jgi:hypothetical protein
MNEKLTVHGNPEKSVFGLIGLDIITDEEKLYIKVENDSKNTGWKEIPPTPSPTPTVTVTPTKTPIVTKSAQTPTPTPTITRTPTQTPSVSQTSPLTSPSPSSTSNKTYYNYSIVSSGGGQANRMDGPNSGTVNVGSGSMQLKAETDTGFIFSVWTAPEGVVLSDPYTLNPIAYGFYVSNDFTITANFISDTPSLPTYNIYATANWQGYLAYEYVDSFGSVQQSFQYGFSPGQVISNAGCANQVTSVTYGSAELTDQSC